MSGTTGRWYDIDLKPVGTSSPIASVVLRTTGASGATILNDNTEGPNQPHLVLSYPPYESG